MLVAELLGLIKQILAQKVPLHLYCVAIHVLILIRVVVLAHLILLLYLLNDAVAVSLSPLALRGAAITAHTRRRALCGAVEV